MSDVSDFPFSTSAGGPANVECGAASSSLPDDSRAASSPPQRGAPSSMLRSVAAKSQQITAINRIICLGWSAPLGGPMRKLAILFAALAFSGPAFAADMLVKAPPPVPVQSVRLLPGLSVHPPLLKLSVGSAGKSVPEF